MIENLKMIRILYVPVELEEGVNMTVDALKEINLGTDEDPRPTYVNPSLENDEESDYADLLKKNKDVFSWIYKEMPILYSKVAVYHLLLEIVHVLSSRLNVVLGLNSFP